MRYSRYMEEEPAVDIWQFNSQIWNVTGDRPTPDVHQTATLMNRLRTPGGFITEAWPYLFATAGLILFAMLVWGALEIQFGAATPKSAESGKQRITNAVIGFVLLFSVFWMGQLIQQIFGLNFAVGQEVSVPDGGGGSGDGNSDPDSPEPLETFTLSSTYQAGSLRVCASAGRDISSQPAAVTNIRYVGDQTQTYSLALQSGSSSRCFTAVTDARVQQSVTQIMNESFPVLSNIPGLTWTATVLSAGSIPNQEVYEIRPEYPDTTALEFQTAITNALSQINIQTFSEVYRVEIGGAVRTFTLNYVFRE